MVLGYMDPGSGSMVAQIVVAGMAGAAVAVKLGWRRTADRIRGLRERDKEVPDEAPAQH